jgi:hypothetical protein
MTKTTKALSGASQDAYFRRILKAYPNLPAEERDRLVVRLRQEIAQLRLRRVVRGEIEAPKAEAPKPEAPVAERPAIAPQPFDPFTPNVIVVLRTSGREAALGALQAIDSPDDLRLLAREQRLAVAGDVASAPDLRAAIVTAAERRIANRMAAAT